MWAKSLCDSHKMWVDGKGPPDPLLLEEAGVLRQVKMVARKYGGKKVSFHYVGENASQLKRMS